MEEKKKEERDPWEATEETYEKEICGKTVVFKANPPAKRINAISRRFRNNPDRGNFELVREIVVKPEITEEMWDNMSARVQGLLIQEILEIIGISSPFLGT